MSTKVTIAAALTVAASLMVSGCENSDEPTTILPELNRDTCLSSPSAARTDFCKEVMLEWPPHGCSMARAHNNEGVELQFWSNGEVAERRGKTLRIHRACTNN